MVKILRIESPRIAIFNNGFSIDFIATDRVYSDSLHNINKSIYTQNVMGFTGVNASGKTSILSILDMAISYLFSEDLSDINIQKNWFDSPVEIIIYFYFDEKIYKLSSIIGTKNSLSNKPELYFIDETLICKSILNVKNRKNLFDFENSNDIEDTIIRSKMKKEDKRFLKDDNSIALMFKDKFEQYLATSIHNTNYNFFQTFGQSPEVVISLFDESIDFIKGIVDSNHDKTSNPSWQLKFKNDDKIYVFSSPMELGEMLSSGTVRGNNIFYMIFNCLLKGGYMIIDEIENHFNKKIVELIINIFMDMSINKKGACLIFSTHYVELLDTFNRKDNIFVLTRNCEQNSIVNKYSDLISRNDIKKSDILLANKICGSAPKYENILALRDTIIKMVNE